MSQVGTDEGSEKPTLSQQMDLGRISHSALTHTPMIAIKSDFPCFHSLHSLMAISLGSHGGFAPPCPALPKTTACSTALLTLF